MISLIGGTGLKLACSPVLCAWHVRQVFCQKQGLRRWRRRRWLTEPNPTNRKNESMIFLHSKLVVGVIVTLLVAALPTQKVISSVHATDELGELSKYLHSLLFIF